MNIIIIIGALAVTILGLTLVGLGIAASLLDKVNENLENIS
jgi:hypothetical protein